MATEVPSPELTSSPPVQGWDSQARMTPARVTGAQAAPGEFAGAELRRGQPAQRRSGRAAFAQARMAAGLGAGPARTASEAAPPEADPLAPSAAAPQGHWLEVRDCRVAGHVLPLVLLHPRFGIAVCGGPVEAAALVRQRLERARFPAIYPGTLPVLRLPGADSAVERAFAAGPPLALPGGDAWVAMARQALETEVSPALPARVGIRARRRRQRHQLLLAGGLAFLLFGAACLGLALLLPEQGPPPLPAGPVPPAEAPSAGPPLVPAPAPAMAGLAAPPAAPARP
ncbi:hypothetical protein QWZ14_19255, partial [Paeniroseomonas aquatica]|nr:hypothetical protein [Paeniroseomonas aquatica]